MANYRPKPSRAEVPNHQRPHYEDRFHGVGGRIAACAHGLAFALTLSTAATFAPTMPMPFWVIVAFKTIVVAVAAAIAIAVIYQDAEAIWYGPYIATKSLMEAFAHVPEPVRIARLRTLNEAIERAFSLSDALEQAESVRHHLRIVIVMAVLAGSGAVLWLALNSANETACRALIFEVERASRDNRLEACWVAIDRPWRVVAVVFDLSTAVLVLAAVRAIIRPTASAAMIRDAVIKAWQGTLTLRFVAHQAATNGVDEVIDLAPAVLALLREKLEGVLAGKG